MHQLYAVKVTWNQIKACNRLTRRPKIAPQRSELILIRSTASHKHGKLKIMMESAEMCCQVSSFEIKDGPIGLFRQSVSQRFCSEI